jgi:hypothetical protein
VQILKFWRFMDIPISDIDIDIEKIFDTGVQIHAEWVTAFW